MKSSTMDCLKYLMFFFNLLFFIVGVAALAIGIWALVNEQSFRDIVVQNQVLFNGIYIIIVVGAALFILGFLGCCGAIKENRCLLATFFGVVLVIFLASIAGVIYVYVKRYDIYGSVEKSIDKYGDGSATGKIIKQGWDTLQATVGCCGVFNYTNWKDDKSWASRNPGKLVPDSCCKHKILSTKSPILNLTLCNAGNSEYLSTTGCKEKLGKSMIVVGGIGIATLFVELLAMIFACCLWKALGEYQTVA